MGRAEASWAKEKLAKTRRQPQEIADLSRNLNRHNM
jgi:hypothetical protein